MIASERFPHSHVPRPQSHSIRPVLSGLFLVLALGAAGLPADAADGSPLRDHLVVKRAALEQRQPESARSEPLEARVTAESRSGVRRMRIGAFQHLSDSDRDYAGYNLGAGSWDTQIAVLASAVADEFVIQAAARNVPLDSLDVIFTSRPDAPGAAAERRVSYPRNLGYVAYIDSPATDAELDALREAVERTSPVLHLVSESQPVGHGRVFHTPSPAERDPDLPPGLRDFLAEKRAAILRRQQRAGGGGGALLRAHAHVEPHTGLRHVRAGGEDGFLFLHDSTPDLAGYGLALTVEQHQLGVLGTCLTHIFEVQAATLQTPLDSLELRLTANLTPRIGSGADAPPRYRNIEYSIHIESPATEQEISALRDAVEASCPLYNLLKDSQPIQGAVVRGRYPDVAQDGAD